MKFFEHLSRPPTQPAPAGQPRLVVVNLPIQRADWEAPVATVVRRPRGGQDAGEFVRMCSWCRSVAQGDRWVQVPAQSAAEVRPITHGICPACLERLLQDQRLTA